MTAKEIITKVIAAINPEGIKASIKDPEAKAYELVVYFMEIDGKVNFDFKLWKINEEGIEFGDVATVGQTQLVLVDDELTDLLTNDISGEVNDLLTTFMKDKGVIATPIGTINRTSIQSGNYIYKFTV